MRMGKASRTKQQPDRRARIAAQREAERRREQRKRIYLAGGSVLVVAIIAIAFVIFKSNGGGASTGSNGPTGAALAAVVKTTTSVPATALDKVGSGGSSVYSPPFKLTPAQPALTSGGKPEMLYVGAEYCPYCAAERWAMVVALSRFGTFTGLATVHSSSTDTDANTPTWTFAKATYTSPYLVFDSVEEFTNIPTSDGYTTLETPTAAEQAVFTKYDSTPFISSSADDGAYPFVDFGNKYEISGASYNPQVLDGKSWATIAAALSDPSSAIAQAADGTANDMTAAICELTGNQPTTACTTVVKSIEPKL